MPDSYGACFTAVGRGRMVRWERPSMSTAFITTKPNSNNTGKYVRDMASQLREKFHKSAAEETYRGSERGTSTAERGRRKQNSPGTGERNPARQARCARTSFGADLPPQPIWLTSTRSFLHTPPVRRTKAPGFSHR